MAGGQMGDTATVTFQVSTPTIATRAVGDGTTATKLYVAVYENQNGTADNLNLVGPLPVSLIDEGETVTFTDRVATVNLALAKNKEYSVIFWAETEDNDDAIFDIYWDTRELKLKSTSTLKANQEKYDAFWAQKTVTLTGALSEKVELKRPFAQLNIGTSDKTAASDAGVVVKESQVVVKNVPTTFNLQTGVSSDPKAVTYTMASIEGIKDEKFPAVATGQQYLSLNYIPMTVDKSLVDIEFKYKDEQDNDAYVLNFPSVPVQRNFRTNIYGTLLTNSANYTVEIKPGFGNGSEEDAANIVYASTADEVLKALSANEESIRIVLLNDITLPGGTTAYTTTAKEVVIESNQSASTRSESGKKFTLTFKDSYRTYFGLANKDAKVTFNNVNIYRETTGGTHWHDNNMKFTCNAEFKNVDFNKGICFDNAKTFVMNNCSINKGKVATYALFITAGCNVTIDGLSVTHSEGVAGRGIKIVDEDVAEKDALTTLSVSNATFVTEEKAAIMVGSQGGAKITLSNLDLTGVKADGFNAVWIDEDYKSISVEVEGGFCVTEGETQTEDNNPFLVENATVPVAKGVYSALPKVANGVTIVAEKGTVFTGTSSVSGKNVTIKNVTFKGEDKALTGDLYGTTFENCHFDATYGAQWCYAKEGEIVFTGCTFGSETSKRGVHFDSGEGSVRFESCTFYGFNALGASLEKLTFNNCDIKVSSKALNGFNGVNMYGTTYVYNNCRFEPGTYTDCAANNVVASYTNCSYTDGNSIYSLVRFDKDPETCTITFDGEEASVVRNLEQLKKAIAGANSDAFTKIVLIDGIYTGAIDIDGKSVQLVAANRHQATIDGLVFGLGASHIKLNGIKLTNAHPVASESPRHKADYYCLGAYAAEFVIDDCVFDVNNQGQAAGKGAINIGDGFNANQNPYELTVTNTVFNCNGERPIRAKTRSYIENCTFNDQHRYAIQVQGNEQAPDEVVVFRNNIINNPCQTSGELFAAGVSISKSQKLSDAAFTIEGNIMNSTEFANLKFVYDISDYIKITTCTLNGKTIVEDQCVSILNEDEAKEVILDFNADLGTYCATEADFTAALNAGKAKIVLAPGTYKGTYAMKGGVTIQSMDDMNMATVDCINLNGADNITLKNIQFDAAGAKLAYDGKGNERFYGNIISGDASKNGKGTRGLVIDGCVFTGTFANGGTTIAFNDQGRTTGQSGNITIKNCTFETVGGYVDIYTYYSGYENLIIEKNTFNSTVVDRPIYLGKYQSSTPVVVKGNAFNKVANIEAAVYLQDHSNYGVSYQAENNTFAQ